MVQDAILTAEFVQSLPVWIGRALGTSADDVIVVTITSAESHAKMRKRDETSGVIVSMAIPKASVSNLQQMIANPSSELYSPTNGQLPTLVDRSFPVTGQASQSSTPNGVSDPNAVNSENAPSSGRSQGGGLSKASIIGICVSIGVVVYAAATVVVVRVYRRRRARRQEQAQEQHQVFAQSISSPIMQENSLGWSYQNQLPYPGRSQW
ncbi:hypothetical protein DFQ30_009000 [Apophysomyces sp. BC1015]|nr:hypothetical protein DFQ30_009000 [Apophysomyces sp. BC1015]